MRLLRVKKRLPELTFYTDQDFKKTRLYSLDKSYFSFFQSQFSHALNVIIILWAALPWLWNTSGRWTAQLLNGLNIATVENIADYEITHSLAFLLLFGIVNTLMDIPWSLYSTFVIEEKHGFNKQTLGLFISDRVKTFLLSTLIGLPCVAACLWVILNTGPLFYIYLAVFVMSLQLILLLIYPTFIQPLFNKVTPLPEGELKTKIEALASELDFPLTKLYVIDGSRRSSHSNAYFYGLFNDKRIVLYDTLIEQMETHDQILAVLGHEIGHWFHSHMTQMIVVSQIHLFVMFYLFSFFNGSTEILQQFGFSIWMKSSGELYTPVIISLILFSYIFAPGDSIMNFMMHVLSRHNEFQADRFAAKLKRSKDLIKALQILSKENRGMVWPDWLYSAWVSDIV